MASGKPPTVALEAQLEIYRQVLAGEFDHEFWKAGVGSRYFSLNKTIDTSPPEVGRNIASSLLQGVPTFFSQEMTEVLQEAMPTIPGSTGISPEDLVAPDLWIWFENPIEIPHKTPAELDDSDGYHTLIEGFNIWQAHTAKLEEIVGPDFPGMPMPEIMVITFGRLYKPGWKYYLPGHKGKAWITDFVDYEGHKIPSEVLDISFWTAGDTIDRNQLYDIARFKFLMHEKTKYAYWSDKMEQRSFDLPTEDLALYADDFRFQLSQLQAATIHFMNQRITRVSQYRMNRAERRRMEHTMPKEKPTSIVQVVTFRPVDYISNGEKSEGSGREYKYRWTSRAHWRNQWYPSLGPVDAPGTHKPVFVKGCIKGPENAPFKDVTKIFSVVR